MIVRSAIVRPWLKAGLSALLLDSEQRVDELRGKERGIEPPVRENTAVRAPAAGNSSRSQAVKPSSRPAPEGAVRTSAAASRTPLPARPERSQTAVSADAGVLATPGALPVEAWPASWLALKNRRPLPPRPLVLWTYAGLGDDLTGTPDDVRRQVIVRMLMELRHPGGTHVFWPCALPGERPEDGPALFWSGVRLLNPRVLLLFGSDARDTLSFPKTLLPFCQDRVYGRLVIQLPRPQALAADEASFKRALAFLSRFLNFCSRRQAQNGTRR